MAKIPIETITDNCWEKCPGFKVRDDIFFNGNAIFYRVLTCENLEVCEHAVSAHAVSVCKEEE